MVLVGKLVVIKGEGKGLSYTIRGNEDVAIGRNLECSIPVPDIKLSRIHCVVRNVAGQFQLLDNNSTNGTYINKQQIELAYSLKSEDIIEIGDTQIQFFCEEQEEHELPSLLEEN